jgi:hypothetical protein
MRPANVNLVRELRERVATTASTRSYELARIVNHRRRQPRFSPESQARYGACG